MTAGDLTEAEIAGRIARLDDLRRAIAVAVVGQDTVVEQLLVALLAGGHALIEGVPGLGKTLFVRTLAAALDLSFRRVQFTPDLMPGDIIGTEVLEDHGGSRSFRFQPGPVFTNLLLADELNRTPPKTQAALLEAMAEHSVSTGGTTHRLAEPFFVLATQNPIEQAGTYPLPEAQLDRFLLNIRVGYPAEAEERAIVAATTGGERAAVPRVMDTTEIVALQALVRQVHVSPDLLAWVTRLVRATRPGSGIAAVERFVRWGAGPRGGQALVLAAKARALLRGRLAATRDDVQALAAAVLRHRLQLGFAADAEGQDADAIVAEVVRGVALPG